MLLLLLFLIVCAVSVSVTKNLLTSLIIYMAFSLVMSIIWVCLQSPDLAITEAAVGAGVTSILFFVTLKKIHAIDVSREGMNGMSQEGNEMTQTAEIFQAADLSQKGEGSQKNDSAGIQKQRGEERRGNRHE